MDEYGEWCGKFGIDFTIPENWMQKVSLVQLKFDTMSQVELFKIKMRVGELVKQLLHPNVILFFKQISSGVWKVAVGTPQCFLLVI